MAVFLYALGDKHVADVAVHESETGPKRTSIGHPYMAAFGGGADVDPGLPANAAPQRVIYERYRPAPIRRFPQSDCCRA